MSELSRRLLALALCAAILPAVAAGQGHGKGKAKHGDEAEDRDDRNDKDRRGPSVIFTTRDRDIIRDYYRNRYSNLPPGLAKRNGNLPPGLQKHLARNGTLPPGLQKRLQPFPADLERRLPALPPYYQRGVIGPDVVVLDTRTQRVLDVIHAIVGR